jgi:hypothetical protein
MFIGHIAVGLGAKKFAPKSSLGTLLMSAQFLDLIWPVFVLLGIEHFRIAPGITAYTPLDFYDYPISHSLLIVLGWSIGFASVYYGLKKDKRVALVLGIGVLSHWVLDFISHRADMPLAPGVDTFVGLGLWNSIPATMIIEFALYALGIYLFLSRTKATDKTGVYAFWGLVGFLFVIWIANSFSPPPPSEMAVGWSALALWLIVPWGYWIDRHRIAS